MMKDILIDATSFKIVNGDFVAGDAYLQNQELILSTSKGDWRAHPEMGTGIIDFIEDENPDLLFREIREQFVLDGLTVKELYTAEGKIYVNAD